MSALIAPRYELPILGSDGRMSREWYKFLVQLSIAVGHSTSNTEDLQIDQLTDSADAQSLARQALAVGQLALSQIDNALLTESFERPREADVSLLAWWPGESK